MQIVSKMKFLKWLMVSLICACIQFKSSGFLIENPEENEIVITGVIKDYDKSSFEFSYDAYALLRSTEKVKVSIDDKGFFKIELNESNPIQGTLSFGKVMVENTGHYRYIYLYLEPGDSVNIKANVNEIENTLTFSGDGIDNNIYVNEEDYMFNTYPQRVKNNYAFIAHKKPNDYKNTIDSIRVKKLKYLEEYHENHEMSDKLFEAYRFIYINDAIIRKINYPSSHKGFNKGVEADLPTDYYDFLQDVELAQNLDHKGMPYLRYTHFYLTNTYEIAKAEGYDKDYLTYIKSQLQGRPLYVYMAYSLGYNFKPEIYHQFGEKSPYPDINDIVEKKYKRLESMLPGKPAPDVMLTNIEGEEVPLSDFQGKYVYLDFWATWCKPCIKEFPGLKKLEETYHGKNITFVSISTDRQLEKWKEFIAKEEMSGLQVHVDNKNKGIIDQAFNIRFIPRFVLIDDEGKIVDANAPRPSNEVEIKKLFDAHLKDI